MLTPENTPVPEGFVHIDFKDLSLGTCWIYGKENEVHDTSACKHKLIENDMKIWQDETEAVWSYSNLEVWYEDRKAYKECIRCDWKIRIICGWSRLYSKIMVGCELSF